MRQLRVPIAIVILGIVIGLAGNVWGAPATAPAPAPAPDVRPVVNVNTATLEQLAYLPGVGPVIAQRIVDARPIADVAALDKVKGIGEKKLELMRAYVVVEGATTATEKIKAAVKP